MIPPDRGQRPSTVADHPRRATTRRTVMTAGALGLGAGLLAPSPVRKLLAQRGYPSELDALDVALALEHHQAALYREGLDRFAEAAFTDAGLPENVRPDLVTIRDQEQLHVDAITEAIADLGGTPGPSATNDTGYDDLAGFLDAAAALESATVAAYAGIVPAVDTRRVLRTVLGLHSVEARHAAYLSALAGLPPFPDAIDAPLARAEALAIARDAAANATPGDPSAGDPAVGEPAGDPDRRRFAPVLEDAAARLGLPIDELGLARVEERSWPDASLGCPEPGNVYAQVITPGFLVVVDGRADRLEYHTDDRGNFVLCS